MGRARHGTTAQTRAHGRRAAETNGYPLTALRGQVCGFNWWTLKVYKSPKRTAARALSTAGDAMGVKSELVAAKLLVCFSCKVRRLK